MNISTYPSIKASQKARLVTIEQWIDQIKTPGYFAEIISSARTARQHDPIEYKRIKTEDLPCFMPNFIYDGGRNDNNLVESTGMLYFDFDCGEPDCAIELKEEIITNQWVYAAWYSLSGTGLGVLVKVDGMPIDQDEFNQAYEQVGLGIGFSGWDKVAATRGRCNVLSHDENAYLNQDSSTFKIKPFLSEVKKVKGTSNNTLAAVSSPFHFFEEEIFNAPAIESGDGMLITQSRLASYPQECVYIPEGAPFYSCYIPFGADGRPTKISNGQRNQVLSAFCHNLICLNPNAEESHIMYFMKKINQFHCAKPLTPAELVGIVKNKFRRRSTLTPMGTRIKKYWVRPGSQNALKAYHTTRSESTKAKVYEFIGDQLMNLSGKITMKRLASEIGISVPTLRGIMKELPEVLAEIKEHNKVQKVKRTTNR